MPKNSLADRPCSNADSEDSVIGKGIESSTTANVIDLPLVLVLLTIIDRSFTCVN